MKLRRIYQKRPLPVREYNYYILQGVSFQEDVQIKSFRPKIEARIFNTLAVHY